MLKEISWNQFIIFFSMVLGIYYLIVAITYYRKDIFRFVNRITGKKTGIPGINARGVKEKSAP